MLGAPVPFIVGIHDSFLLHKDCNFGEETIKIYLDLNKIEFGNETIQLPILPEKRLKKLKLVMSQYANIFELRSKDWIETRLPYYDDAYSSINNNNSKVIINENELREGFLKFFVAILKNYRK